MTRRPFAVLSKGNLMLNLNSEEIAKIVREEVCKLKADSKAKPTPIMIYELKVLHKIL